MDTQDKKHIIVIRREVEKEMVFLGQQNSSFCEEAYSHILRQGCSKIVFELKTGLSDKTYEKIKAGTLYHPKPKTVMSLCVGLRLPYEYSVSLFEKAGYNLRGSPIQIAYRKILLSRKSLSISECNEILAALNLPPLSIVR